MLVEVISSVGLTNTILCLSKPSIGKNRAFRISVTCVVSGINQIRITHNITLNARLTKILWNPYILCTNGLENMNSYKGSIMLSNSSNGNRYPKS